MTTLDAKALEAAWTEFDQWATDARGRKALAYAITAYLSALPPQPVEVTEEMVERAFRDGLSYATNVTLSRPEEHDIAWLTSRARAATRPSGDGIRAGRAEVIEECAKVADAMRQERAQMATDEDDQAEMDVLNGQAFIARCIAKNIRALIVPQEAVKE